MSSADGNNDHLRRKERSRKRAVFYDEDEDEDGNDKPERKVEEIKINAEDVRKQLRLENSMAPVVAPEPEDEETRKLVEAFRRKIGIQSRGPTIRIKSESPADVPMPVRSVVAGPNDRVKQERDLYLSEGDAPIKKEKREEDYDDDEDEDEEYEEDDGDGEYDDYEGGDGDGDGDDNNDHDNEEEEEEQEEAEAADDSDQWEENVMYDSSDEDLPNEEALDDTLRLLDIRESQRIDGTRWYGDEKELSDERFTVDRVLSEQENGIDWPGLPAPDNPANPPLQLPPPARKRQPLTIRLVYDDSRPGVQSPPEDKLVRYLPTPDEIVGGKTSIRIGRRIKFDITPFSQYDAKNFETEVAKDAITTFVSWFRIDRQTCENIVATRNWPKLRRIRTDQLNESKAAKQFQVWANRTDAQSIHFDASERRARATHITVMWPDFEVNDIPILNDYDRIGSYMGPRVSLNHHLTYLKMWHGRNNEDIYFQRGVYLARLADASLTFLLEPHKEYRQAAIARARKYATAVVERQKLTGLVNGGLAVPNDGNNAWAAFHREEPYDPRLLLHIMAFTDENPTVPRRSFPSPNAYNMANVTDD